ncbi:hypothetical protein EMPS_10662 [Entomortierella parvispora]|uniref:Uncharacterized protein n=1 Tax=Entomortierella parvispora TaxID=205924 RepID=A0A9P3HL06_9FUNG|nr:hypothetical protein EMPS_10662 [Entomortierella parvispora]
MSDQIAISPFSPLASSPHVVQGFSYTGGPAGSVPADRIGPMDMYTPLPEPGQVAVSIDDTTQPLAPQQPPQQPQQPPQFQQQYNSGLSYQLHQLQQQQQPQQQLQHDQTSFLPAMAPLQPMFSNQSANSVQSEQSFQSASSALSAQNGHGGPMEGQGPGNQMHAGGHPLHGHHLAPPAAEKSKSRRWSLTGRFFEKRKSVTEPFHIPNSHPQQFAASYGSYGQSNIVYGNRGGGGGGGGGPPTVHMNSSHAGPSGGTMEDNLGNNNNSSNNNSSNNSIGKQISPPGSNSGSRRSSLADIPKALLSSFRRGSITPSSSSADSSGGNMAPQAMAGVMSPGRADEDDDDDEAGNAADDEALTPGQPHITMAVPKRPPQDARTLAHLPPPKSILKKRLSVDSTGTPSGSVTSASLAGAGPGGVNSTTGSGGNDGTAADALGPDTVHPMATADMDVADISLLTPTDHRARLLTHSPTPNHPQQHVMGQEDQLGVQLAHKLAERYYTSAQGAAIPPDFTPGVQPNSSYRGGERLAGAVGPVSHPPMAAAAASSQDMISQDEMLTQQMLSQQVFGISARAQDLASQYYSGNGPVGGQMQQQNSGGGQKRRQINFLETVEIIPAHRKSDYNRQSDKHATFKVLTPDLKSEIRDELNTYKMREMAVHVESMGNTAFH